MPYRYPQHTALADLADALEKIMNLNNSANNTIDKDDDTFLIDTVIDVEGVNQFDIYEASVAEKVFGYITIPHDEKLTTKQRNHAVIKIVMNRMGFSNVKDYSESYPGCYKDGTINRDIIDLNSNSKHIYSTYKIISKTYFKNMIKHNLSKYNNIVTYPTINEAMKCDYFNDVDLNDLWFCEDWNEAEWI